MSGVPGTVFILFFKQKTVDFRGLIFKQEKGRASKTLARITSAGRALRFSRVLTAFARFFAGFARKKNMRKCVSKIV